MAAATSELKIVISAKDMASKAFGSFRGSVGKVFKAMTSLKGLLLTGAGFYALKRALTACIAASNLEEQAIAGLHQALVSMGRYTPELEAGLLAHADALQKVTTFGNEATIAGMKFLLTYRDIGEDALPRATKAMLDLAALMGGDTRQAANMLGKASMGMTGELRRVGITVSKVTYEQEGFLGVLREIEAQVGGQAEALRRNGGALTAYRNALGDVKERLGDIAKVFMTPVWNVMTELFSGWSDQLKTFRESDDFGKWAEGAIVNVADFGIATLKTMDSIYQGIAGFIGKIKSNWSQVWKYGLLGAIAGGFVGGPVGVAVGAGAGVALASMGGVGDAMAKGMGIDVGKGSESRDFLKEARASLGFMEEGMEDLGKTTSITGSIMKGFIASLEKLKTMAPEAASAMQGGGAKTGAAFFGRAGAGLKYQPAAAPIQDAPMLMGQLASPTGWEKTKSALRRGLGDVEQQFGNTWAKLESGAQSAAWAMRDAFAQGFLDVIEGKTEGFVDAIDSLWLTFRENFKRVLVNMLADFAASKALELAKHVWTEKAKTKVTQAEAAKRAAGGQAGGAAGGWGTVTGAAGGIGGFLGGLGTMFAATMIGTAIADAFINSLNIGGGTTKEGVTGYRTPGYGSTIYYDGGEWFNTAGQRIEGPVFEAQVEPESLEYVKNLPDEIGDSWAGSVPPLANPWIETWLKIERGASAYMSGVNRIPNEVAAVALGQPMGMAWMSFVPPAKNAMGEINKVVLGEVNRIPRMVSDVGISQPLAMSWADFTRPPKLAFSEISGRIVPKELGRIPMTVALSAMNRNYGLAWKMYEGEPSWAFANIHERIVPKAVESIPGKVSAGASEKYRAAWESYADAPKAVFRDIEDDIDGVIRRMPEKVSAISGILSGLNSAELGGLSAENATGSISLEDLRRRSENGERIISEKGLY